MEKIFLFSFSRTTKMFTGIIESTGKILKSLHKRDSLLIEISCENLINEIKIGDSVSINGACLTVVEKKDNSFSMEVSYETIERTTIKKLKTGDIVNLEIAMKFNGRVGGHFVTGHIDGTGKIIRKEMRGDFFDLYFSAHPTIMKFIVEKGSIAIDGISLTVNRVFPDSFSVTIIPYTTRNTNIGLKKIGDEVNIESDIIGKYVYSFVGKEGGRITEEFLKKHGFI